MNDATGEGGDELVEIMAGTFIICGFNPDSGEDTSLTPQQAEHWIRRLNHTPQSRKTGVRTPETGIRTPIERKEPS